MSYDYLSAVINMKGLHRTAKMVLIHLSGRYNPDFGCFPRQDSIAEACEMSRRSVNYHLGTLEELGFIYRQRRYDSKQKKQRSTRYIFWREYAAMAAGEDLYPDDMWDSDCTTDPEALAAHLARLEAAGLMRWEDGRIVMWFEDGNKSRVQKLHTGRSGGNPPNQSSAKSSTCVQSRARPVCNPLHTHEDETVIEKVIIPPPSPPPQAEGDGEAGRDFIDVSGGADKPATGEDDPEWQRFVAVYPRRKDDSIAASYPLWVEAVKTLPPAYLIAEAEGYCREREGKDRGYNKSIINFIKLKMEDYQRAQPPSMAGDEPAKADDPPPILNPFVPLKLRMAWERIRFKLKEDLGRNVWKNWISGLDVKGREGDTILLATKSSFVAARVNSQYADRLRVYWRGEDKSVRDVKVVLHQTLPPKPPVEALLEGSAANG